MLEPSGLATTQFNLSSLGKRLREVWKKIVMIYY
jgi:hypothetical protein